MYKSDGKGEFETQGWLKSIVSNGSGMILLFLQGMVGYTFLT